MERLTKPIFIFLLLSISISASVFMIIESGTFFQDLYKANQSISFMGYWAAFLNEVFMGIMAAVWLPGKQNTKGESIHPVNILFKMLLVFLFATTVCGSSLNTVYPLVGALQEQSNQKKVIQVLQSQVEDNKVSLDAFVQQNQRVNAALSVKNQVRIKKELRDALQQQASLFSLWIEIIVIILIRFCVQLANLSCIWLAGWLYRRPVIVNTQKSQSSIIATLVPQDHIISKQPAIDLKTEPQRTTPIKAGSAENKNDSGKILYTFAQANRHKVSVSNSPKALSRNSERDDLLKDNLTQISEIKNKITKLLMSRNEGISLSEVGKAIGEREARLREIVDPKTNFRSTSGPALLNILMKIENLYNEEHSRMY